MPESGAFSIAVTGRDCALLGMFLTRGMKRFPDATFYDRTPKTLGAIAQEVSLAANGLTDADSTESAARAAKNLADPPAVSVTVSFLLAGKRSHATVSGRGRRETRSYCLEAAKSMEEILGWADELLDLAGTMR